MMAESTREKSVLEMLFSAGYKSFKCTPNVKSLVNYLGIPAAIPENLDCTEALMYDHVKHQRPKISAELEEHGVLPVNGYTSDNDLELKLHVTSNKDGMFDTVNSNRHEVSFSKCMVICAENIKSHPIGLHAPKVFSEKSAIIKNIKQSDEYNDFENNIHELYIDDAGERTDQTTEEKCLLNDKQHLKQTDHNQAETQDIVKMSEMCADRSSPSCESISDIDFTEDESNEIWFETSIEKSYFEEREMIFPMYDNSNKKPFNNSVNSEKKSEKVKKENEKVISHEHVFSELTLESARTTTDVSITIDAENTVLNTEETNSSNSKLKKNRALEGTIETEEDNKFGKLRKQCQLNKKQKKKANLVKIGSETNEAESKTSLEEKMSCIRTGINVDVNVVSVSADKVSLSEQSHDVMHKGKKHQFKKNETQERKSQKLAEREVTLTDKKECQAKCTDLNSKDKNCSEEKNNTLKTAVKKRHRSISSKLNKSNDHLKEAVNVQKETMQRKSYEGVKRGNEPSCLKKDKLGHKRKSGGMSCEKHDQIELHKAELSINETFDSFKQQFVDKESQNFFCESLSCGISSASAKISVDNVKPSERETSSDLVEMKAKELKHREPKEDIHETEQVVNTETVSIPEKIQPGNDDDNKHKFVSASQKKNSKCKDFTKKRKPSEAKKKGTTLNEIASSGNKRFKIPLLKVKSNTEIEMKSPIPEEVTRDKVYNGPICNDFLCRNKVDQVIHTKTEPLNLRASNKPFECIFCGLFAFSSHLSLLEHEQVCQKAGKQHCDKDLVERKRRMSSDNAIECHTNVNIKQTPSNARIRRCSRESLHSVQIEHVPVDCGSKGTLETSCYPHTANKETKSDLAENNYQQIMNTLLKCNICGKKYDFLTELVSHKSKEHSSPSQPTKVQFCKNCKMPYYTSDAGFAKHMLDCERHAKDMSEKGEQSQEKERQEINRDFSNDTVEATEKIRGGNNTLDESTDKISDKINIGGRFRQTQNGTYVKPLFKTKACVRKSPVEKMDTINESRNTTGDAIEKKESKLKSSTKINERLVCNLCKRFFCLSKEQLQAHVTYKHRHLTKNSDQNAIKCSTHLDAKIHSIYHDANTHHDRKTQNIHLDEKSQSGDHSATTQSAHLGATTQSAHNGATTRATHHDAITQSHDETREMLRLSPQIRVEHRKREVFCINEDLGNSVGGQINNTNVKKCHICGNKYYFTDSCLATHIRDVHGKQQTSLGSETTDSSAQKAYEKGCSENTTVQPSTYVSPRPLSGDMDANVGDADRDDVISVSPGRSSEHVRSLSRRNESCDRSETMSDGLNSPDVKVFRCFVCGWVFPSSFALRRHFSFKHKGNYSPIKRKYPRGNTFSRESMSSRSSVKITDLRESISSGSPVKIIDHRGIKGRQREHDQPYRECIEMPQSLDKQDVSKEAEGGSVNQSRTPRDRFIDERDGTLQPDRNSSARMQSPDNGTNSERIQSSDSRLYSRFGRNEDRNRKRRFSQEDTRSSSRHSAGRDGGDRSGSEHSSFDEHSGSPFKKNRTGRRPTIRQSVHVNKKRPIEHKCFSCKQVFPSKGTLWAHLKREGHIVKKWVWKKC
ncbi:uncharacterized protein LOC128209713 [Mya arenaria]|uniref:uncharacterized protein LOC128209713 n=1 Tax=Mya arenaria TaxID=6604 RepID=UPI0022E991D1|nr:uncharacterized protein LOC128209713 [Mya arenaria]